MFLKNILSKAYLIQAHNSATFFIGSSCRNSCSNSVPQLGEFFWLGNFSTTQSVVTAWRTEANVSSPPTYIYHHPPPTTTTTGICEKACRVPPPQCIARHGCQEKLRQHLLASKIYRTCHITISNDRMARGVVVGGRLCHHSRTPPSSPAVND